MGLQNRVDPFGELIFTEARGRWMGNRGKLHNHDKQVVRQWKSKAWLLCDTSFGTVKREVFSASSYSELFFLDEATALSAGHRPCSDCRKTAFKEFKSRWRQANMDGFSSETPAQSVLVSVIDARLHAERTDLYGRKLTHEILFREVPHGAFISLEGIPHLHWNGRLHEWAPDGYTLSPVYPSTDAPVTVLTPPSIVNLMRLGFRPQVDRSAESTTPTYTFIGDLFTEKPARWGLRGDPYLWEDLARMFAPVPLPDREQTLRDMLDAAFLALTAHPISADPYSVHVERYAHGGMSAGMVSPDYWLETGFPLILSRYHQRPLSRS